jgi:bacillopeptidase F
MDSEKHVSSRLIKQERKKLVRQTFVYIGAAIVLVLIFIFVVLPLFIRFINSVLNTNPIAEEEAALLQPPALSAPIDATKSAELKISGYDSPEHQVVIVLNGQEHTRVSTAADGTFSADIALTEGENSVSGYSIDNKENESPPSDGYTVILDTEKPTLTVVEPTEGATINARDRQVTVAGTTDVGGKIYINDRVVFPNADGTFSAKHSLTDGKNEITVKAVDKAGNETIQKITVEFTP